jgi:hypothetical protein
MDYQATPFRGEWNEDPENFLGWFLQCTSAADDEMKARHFVYYLQADSDADEWFEDLPKEDKRSWARIEGLFRRKWLKEVISIKEVATNEPQPAPTHPQQPTPSIIATTQAVTDLNVAHNNTHGTISPTFKLSVRTTGALHNQTPTVIKISKINIQATPVIPMSSTLAVITDVAPAHPGKPTKIPKKTEKPPEIAQKWAFSPHKHSDTPISLPTMSSQPTKATTNLWMPENANDIIFHPKKSPSAKITEKFEIQTTKRLSNEVTALYDDSGIQIEPSSWKSTQTGEQSLLQVLDPSHPPTLSRHEKSALLCAVFESQPPTGSLAPTTFVTGLKTRSASTGFTENNQNVEKSPIFAQKAPEPIVSSHSNCADDISSLPTPTTIVTALETHSVTVGLTQKRPKMRILTNFNQNHLKSLVLDHFNWADDTESLSIPPIAPTKHPCDLPGEYCNVFFSSHLSFRSKFWLDFLLLAYCHFHFILLTLFGIYIYFTLFCFLCMGYFFLGDEGVAIFRGGHME